jgi:hypothetical protein
MFCNRATVGDSDLRVNVLRNEHYVRSIEVDGIPLTSPSYPLPEPSLPSAVHLQRHDSIVTDSLLQMTSFSNSDWKEREESSSNDASRKVSEASENSPLHSAREEMDKVGRDKVFY